MADAIKVVIDDKEVSAWIKRLKGKASRMNVFMQKAANIMHQDIDNHFQHDKKDSKGKLWPDVKRNPGKGSLLLRTGALRNSIYERFSNTNAEVGTNMEYAATHNFGDKSRNIPKREFLWVSDKAIQMIEKTFINELED